MTETIPPLPKLKIHEFDKKFLNQAMLDHAMRIIYERRPDFFRRSAERDKKWESDPTQDEEAWVHDGFSKEFRQFIHDEVAKEVDLPDLNAQTSVLQHARSVARLMYGMSLRPKLDFTQPQSPEIALTNNKMKGAI